MIIGHIMGIPVEESFLQLAPAGAVAVTVAAIAARTRLGRVLARISHAVHCMRARVRFS